MHPRDAQDERQFIDALLVGNERAWRDFGYRYRAIVMRCIRSVTNRFARVSPEDASEIYGEWQLSLVARGKAKLRAYDRARSSGLSSYLAMLAIRCAYDWLRRARRDARRPIMVETSHDRSESPDPFEIAAGREAAALVARALARLSERDRHFATLYFGEGMHPRQIARSMKISVKTVYTKKHKLKLKLASLLARIQAPNLAA